MATYIYYLEDGEVKKRFDNSYIGVKTLDKPIRYIIHRLLKLKLPTRFCCCGDDAFSILPSKRYVEEKLNESKEKNQITKWVSKNRLDQDMIWVGVEYPTRNQEILDDDAILSSSAYIYFDDSSDRNENIKNLLELIKQEFDEYFDIKYNMIVHYIPKVKNLTFNKRKSIMYHDLCAQAEFIGCFDELLNRYEEVYLSNNDISTCYDSIQFDKYLQTKFKKDDDEYIRQRREKNVEKNKRKDA